MEKIKFRQRIGDEWHYWGFIEDKYRLSFVAPITHGITIEQARKDSQQFTGLLDKNKKEIYEGDIVKWSEKIYMIEWHKKIAAFVMQHNNLERPDVEYKSEVIGNIYETPNLLK